MGTRKEDESADQDSEPKGIVAPAQLAGSGFEDDVDPHEEEDQAESVLIEVACPWIGFSKQTDKDAGEDENEGKQHNCD